MGEIIVKNKGFAFAFRVVNFYGVLTERKDYILSKQLVRSGTSFGANVREAINIQSKADFIHKSSISQKECDENMYRLELLKATNYISEKKFTSIYDAAVELLKNIRSTLSPLKVNLIHNT